MTESLPTKEKVPATVKEWTVAWRDFQAACKKLHGLAERDGDSLNINVKYKIAKPEQKR